MKFDEIDSTELLINNQEFIRLANFIYRFLKKDLTSFTEKQVKSFTTLLANFELENHKESSEEELIFRTKEYVNRINDDAEYLSNIDDEFNLWLNFLIIATGSRNIDTSMNIDSIEVVEGQYLKYLEIIHRSGIFAIEKVIWKIKEPAISKVFLKEIEHLIYSNPNYDLLSLISNIGVFQKGLVPVINILMSAIKSRDLNLSDHKQCKQFIHEHRNFIIQNCRKIFSRIFRPHQIISNAKEFYTKAMRSFDQRFRQRTSLRKGMKKARAAEKNKGTKDMLYSMLHSHSPIENMKIPEVIAANSQIKREARRLMALGMTVAEGCDKAIMNNPEHNKFRSLVTRVSKGSTVKI